MEAIDLAKLLYPALSKDDIKYMTCPDNLQICDKVDCKKDKIIFDEDCEKCWDTEVSEDRVNWLIESKKMCDYMC